MTAYMMKLGAERGNGIHNIGISARALVEKLGGDPDSYFQLPPHLAAAYLASLVVIQNLAEPEQT